MCAVCRHDVPLTDHNYLEENAVDRRFYGRIPIKKAASFVFFTHSPLNLVAKSKFQMVVLVGVLCFQMVVLVGVLCFLLNTDSNA